MSPPGKPGEQDASESGTDGFESSDPLLRSWDSQSSLLDVQRVPSFESFEDDCSQSLCLSKPTMSFKDYIQERSDPAEQGKPVIPAAVLAGFTGECCSGPRPLPPRARPRPAPALLAGAFPAWARCVYTPRPTPTQVVQFQTQPSPDPELEAGPAGGSRPVHSPGVGENTPPTPSPGTARHSGRGGAASRPLPLTHPLGECQRM